MKRFIEGQRRTQATFLPECIDDYIVEDNPVRVIEASVDELELQDLGFQDVMPEETGTSLRNAQGVDGSNAFPDLNTATNQYRDESACPRLQHEAGDEDPGNRGIDGGHPDLIVLHLSSIGLAAQPLSPSMFSHSLGQKRSHKYWGPAARKRTPNA